MLDDDGLQLDEVGPWAKEKHERLRKYVDISRAVRRKFLRKSGCATYIDLFSGSGRAFVRDTGEKIDGSPLVAFKCARDGGEPFSEIHIADLEREKVTATAKRIVTAGGTATTYVGKAEDIATQIVARLDPYGLHFAFLDPYNLDTLSFSVIEALGRLKHVDILIHVSAQDLQRNLDAYTKPEDNRLERFAPGWRQHVGLDQSQHRIRAALLSYWASKFETLGLSPAEHAELISGQERNQRLYWLVLVSRHKLARDFWDKIRSVSGQRELPL
jgi:three-Cys-motif partner protein